VRLEETTQYGKGRLWRKEKYAPTKDVVPHKWKEGAGSTNVNTTKQMPRECSDMTTYALIAGHMSGQGRVTIAFIVCLNSSMKKGLWHDAAKGIATTCH